MKPIKRRKRYAVLLLEQTARPADGDERLAFAVIAQAVEDVDAPGKQNSQEGWHDGDVAPWCELLGLEYDYVCRVLNEQLLLHDRLIPAE